MSIKYKGQTISGPPGKDATINGENAVEIVAGENVSIEQQDGTLTISAAGGGIPSGCILIWSGASNAVPDGWALCDGTNGTPDLRGRFVLGESESHAVGSMGGSEEVTLTIAQIPSHSHATLISKDGDAGSFYNVRSSDEAQSGYAFNTSSVKVSTGTANGVSATGGSSGHPNMPPYYVLCYIMKL